MKAHFVCSIVLTDLQNHFIRSFALDGACNIRTVNSARSAPASIAILRVPEARFFEFNMFE